MSLSDRAPPGHVLLQGLGSVTSTMKESEEWGGGERGGEVRGRGRRWGERGKGGSSFVPGSLLLPLTELFCSDEKKPHLRTSLSLLTATQRSTLGTGGEEALRKPASSGRNPHLDAAGVPKKGIPRSSPDPPPPPTALSVFSKPHPRVI